MEYSPYEQVKELVTKSNKILILTKKEASKDIIGSALAIRSALSKIDKEVELVSPNNQQKLADYLVGSDKIKSSFEGGNDFIIKVDIEKNKVREFSYDFDNDGKKLNIYITPEKGRFTEENVSSESRGFQCDLVITLGCSHLESLGDIYSGNKELFYETPIVNIDNHKGNGKFGEINLVDSDAASISEMTYSVISNIGENMIDKNIATALLFGIISGTRSFQEVNTSPAVFTVAAQLVSLGADQQKIVQNMFKNKSLSVLRLWGRALAKIKFDQDKKIVWTVLSKKDFSQVEAKESDIKGVEEELMSMVPEVNIAVVLYESLAGEGLVKGIISSFSRKTLEEVGKKIGIELKNGSIDFTVKGQHVLEVEKEILKKIK